VAFWRRKERTPPTDLVSINDPALAAWFGITPSYAGVSVGEDSALSLSAVWRAVSLISGTIAGLPLKTMRDLGDGTRVRVSSFLDNPAGPESITAYEWVETVLAHLLIWGNAFLIHRYNGAGAIIGLTPVHPGCVSVEYAPGVPGGKTFKVSVDGKQREFDASTMTHIPGLSSDGLRGFSPITVARHSLGTSIAADRSAAKMFSSGLLVSGVVSVEENVTQEEAKSIAESLSRNVGGWENAGEIALVNRKVKWQPWQMSSEDAQFLESRSFQVEEIARWYGIPPHLLMSTEKSTSWGTGIEEQNRGLARYTLSGWTTRIEQRLSRLLAQPRFVQFDYAGLLQPSPEVEIDLLIKQVRAGLLTPNEARRMRGMDPMPDGDTLHATSAPAPEAVPA
jgi:HK97 family phage portal protein